MQTFGDLVNFNPHLHVLAADGAFLPGGRFVALPRVPAHLLAEGFRRAVLDYRSKMHAGLKRNFQVMPGAEWLALLCKHIPDRYEQLMRYVGWYSKRARGERAKKASPRAGVALPSPGEAPGTELAARAKAAWARLITRCPTSPKLPYRQ